MNNIQTIVSFFRSQFTVLGGISLEYIGTAPWMHHVQWVWLTKIVRRSRLLVTIMQHCDKGSRVITAVIFLAIADVTLHLF